MAKPQDTGFSLYNRVNLVRGGQSYFDLLEKLIDNAKHVIFFQTYIFDGGPTGKRVAEMLLRAGQRGVQVYVLLDGYASQGLSRDIIDSWKAAGVFFRWFSPLLMSRFFYFGRRLHHKVLAVDGIDGLVGGINISDKYNDTAESIAWLDWAIHIRGETVAELHDICSHRARHHWLSGRKYKPIPLPEVKISDNLAKCKVRIRVNDWVRRKQEITRSYHDMLRNSKSEVILMSSYFLPGETFRRQMRLALKRGVKIKVVVAGKSDVWLAKLAERYLYHWMMKHRVEIYEYQPSVLHAKISVCDGEWVTVGSYNLNELSARASVELNVDVDNAPFAELVTRELESIIEKDCVRVTSRSDWRSTFLNRLANVAAFQLLRLTLAVFTFYFKQHKNQ